MQIDALSKEDPNTPKKPQLIVQTIKEFIALYA